MASSKAGGKTRQHPPRPGKRLGLKATQGEEVKSGEILVRQRGSNYCPGKNVAQGKDFTLFALKKGHLFFKQKQDKVYLEIRENDGKTNH